LNAPDINSPGKPVVASRTREKESVSEDDPKRSFIEATRRAQIIQCAIDVIAEFGYTRASLAHVAERANITPSAILYYFRTKKELVQEVWTHLLRVRDAYLKQIKDETNARTALRRLIEANAAVYAAHPNEMQAGIYIIFARETESDAPKYHPAHHEPRRNELRRIMEWGQSTGEFRQFDIPSMMRAITATIDLIQWQRSSDPDFDLTRYGETLVQFFDRVTRNDSK
jgi:TetR/AcrR family transcriptional regulator, fatty acid metabolism regulator protein